MQGRMALLVTLFLVLVNIFNAITTNSPKGQLRTELSFRIPIHKPEQINKFHFFISIFQLTGSTLFRPGWLLVYFSSLVSFISITLHLKTNPGGLNFKTWVLGALFEYSVILLQMKIKTIRQIRKCMNGNLAAYLSPLVTQTD